MEKSSQVSTLCVNLDFTGRRYDRRCAQRKACSDRDVDAIVFHVINAPLATAAESYGFLRREPTRHLLVCPEHSSEFVNRAVQNPQNWLITMADSDIDRPW